MRKKRQVDVPPDEQRICGTDSLHQLVREFGERRKVDAEINTSDWRLGDDNHVDGHYLGSQRLHEKLQAHREDFRQTGETDGYNVHFHPELHASWTFGIYGVGSEALCKTHNEHQTMLLKSGDVRYNRHKWREVRKDGKLEIGGRSLPTFSPLRKFPRPSFTESFVIRGQPSKQGYELTWEDRHKKEISDGEIQSRLSRLHVSPVRSNKNRNWRYNESYFKKQYGLY